MDEIAQAVTAAVREVPFQIWDLTDTNTPDLKPGFYFNVPMPEEAKAHSAEIFLEGPYDTRQQAFEAARAFVIDALTDHNQETPGDAADH